MEISKYDKKYKEFLRMEKRASKIRELLREIPLTKLEEPYQQGWRINYVLRDDIKKRKDAPILKQVLEIGYGKGSFTNNVNHVKAIRRGERTIRGRKGVIIDLIPPRHRISEAEYEALPIKVKQHFTLDTTSDVYRLYGRKYYYADLPSYYIVLKARPNIITHTRKKGGALEEELAYLNKKLDEFWRIYYNYSKSFPKSKARTQTRDKIQKFIKGEIDDIYNEKIPLEWEY